MQTLSNIQVSDVVDADEPVTLTEVKDWPNVDFNDDDLLLSTMAIGARQTIEKKAGLVLVEKTVTFDVCTTCAEVVALPYGKEVEDLAIVSLNDSDEETALTSGTDYFLRGVGLRLPKGGRYAVSYTAKPGEIGEDLKECIKMEVAERYQNRGENSGELSKSAMSKLEPHVVIWL